MTSEISSGRTDGAFLGLLQTAALIAVTGYGQAEDRRRSSEAGFDAHLVKPVSQSLLAGLIAGG